MTESPTSRQEPSQVLCTTELRRNAHVLVLQEMRTRLTDAGSPSRTTALDAAISALSARPSPGGQRDALEIAQLQKLVSGILSTVSLGHQTGPYAYAGEDFGRYLSEAAGDCRKIMRLLSDLAARQPVRIYGCCAQPEGELHTAECPNLRHLAARQPVGQEPVLWVSPDVLDAMAIHRAQDFPAGGMGLACPAGSATVPLYVAQPAQAVDLGTGIKAIASERERQLCIEGFSRDSDEQYREGELARAATAYVQLAAMDLQVGSRTHIASQEPPFFWPWAPEWWKPADARHDLVRAGALIAAQIDLIDSQAVGNG